jgi:excisionase family DNA binding protein
MGGLRDDGGRRSGEALLSAEEVAEYVGVSMTTVYQWCKEGRIRCMKIGKLWRVRREDLAHFQRKGE